MKRIIFLSISLIFWMICPSLSHAQVMSDYCQMPPFLANPVEPNVLLLIDTSGSMGWNAYSYGDTDANRDGILDHYNPSITYEGYFDPEKYYAKDANGIWVETTPTGDPCQKTCVSWKCRYWNLGDCVWKGNNCSRWACCTSWQQSGDCGIETGNYLNYLYMTRIDLLRWALTGGSPSSCNNQITTCDPEVYGQPNANLSCDDEGCILLSSSNEKVKARWERITGPQGGLLFQLKALGLKPRIGAMFFSSRTVNRTVYIGDFVASANFDGTNPYKNTITAINYKAPGGATPIAPALWDAYNYLAQLTPPIWWSSATDRCW